MKKFLSSLIVATFSLMVCLPIHAKFVRDEQHLIVRLTKSTISSTVKPRSVQSCITCYYFNDELSFDSYEDISNFTVSIIDGASGQTAAFFLSGLEDTIAITLSVGSYRIELRTFDGQVFEGILTISK